METMDNHSHSEMKIDRKMKQKYNRSVFIERKIDEYQQDDMVVIQQDQIMPQINYNYLDTTSFNSKSTVPSYIKEGGINYRNNK